MTYSDVAHRDFARVWVQEWAGLYLVFPMSLKISLRIQKIMPEPVKPATKSDDIRPREVGKRLEMCRLDR